jgi:hypothetical protein
MEWFQAPDYWLARFLFERALAVIYLIAFWGTANQFPALAGERGLPPAPHFLAAVPFRAAPVSAPVVVYGTRWCGASQMVRRYLDRLGIPTRTWTWRRARTRRPRCAG